MRMVARWVEKTNYRPLCWDDPSVFPVGRNLLNSLIDISQTIAGAILIFSEEDQNRSRNDSGLRPIDNVLIEYGFFAATLGQENTIICIKGNPGIPADLRGIIYADLGKSAQAEEQIAHWISTLKPRTKSLASPQDELLATMREPISVRPDQKARPFLSWLCSRHLEGTLKAVQPIREQIERHGAFVYKHEVVKQLSGDQTDTVLALCGRKFTQQQDNENYFNEFYEFAEKRQARGPKHSDGIYVCRIFVEEDSGQLAEFMRAEFQRHEESRESGVLGLTIKSDKRKGLDHWVGDGFSKCLDEGFGFLLFYGRNGSSTIIIHEGTDHDMAFVTLCDQLNVHRILEIYEVLCWESVQYPKESARLKELLNRLQPRLF